jgi:membrane complex biogenesis BtpA family protein
MNLREVDELFGCSKPIVAMVHFPALPGRPRHDQAGGMDHIVDAVGRDVEVLQSEGVDGLLFCNEADLPYQLHTAPEAATAMANVIGQLRRDIRVPFGVDMVWDPVATLAVARATGARFAREVFTGVYESDLGIMQPDFGSIASYQQSIGASDVRLFGNVTPEFASTIGQRSVAERARSAVYLGLDVILISGQITGTPVDLEVLREAKSAVGDTPVFANTGVRADTAASILAVADGALVGTSLKVDGITWNPVDPARVGRLMEVVQSARATGVPGDR